MGSYFKGDEKYRGIALVIGNEKFDIPYGESNINRRGCSEDIRMMKSMFEKLDFFVECFKDLTAQEMREKIKKASQDERNKESQCFVLGISTHGRETHDLKKKILQHEIFGSDRNPVMVEEILEMFDEKNATGLKDKPKMFFIQACRSKENSIECYDKGITATIMTSKSSNFYERDISEFDKKDFNNCDNIYAEWVRDEHGYDPPMPKVPESQPEPICYPGNKLPEPGLSGDGGGSTDHSKQIPVLEPAGDASRSTDASNKLPEQEPVDDASRSTDASNKHPEQEPADDASRSTDASNKPLEQETSSNASRSTDASNKLPELEPAGDAIRSTNASNKRPEQETTTDAVPPTGPVSITQDPFDVLSVKCPKDCLIYYPVESGKVALRSKYNGSVMYQAMYQQFPKLLKGYSIIKYLTYVNMELSKRNLFYVNEYVKITGSYMTRMNKHVVFKPLTKNSPMAEAQKWYKVDVH